MQRKKHLEKRSLGHASHRDTSHPGANSRGAETRGTELAAGTSNIRRSRAQEALSLLWTMRPSGRHEIDNDPQACLVQARLPGIPWRTEQASLSQLADKSLKSSRQVRLLWHLKLRLLDAAGGGQQDWSDAAELGVPNFRSHASQSSRRDQGLPDLELRRVPRTVRNRAPTARFSSGLSTARWRSGTRPRSTRVARDLLRQKVDNDSGRSQRREASAFVGRIPDAPEATSRPHKSIRFLGQSNLGRIQECRSVRSIKIRLNGRTYRCERSSGCHRWRAETLAQAATFCPSGERST